jgi:hypothetical protein
MQVKETQASPFLALVLWPSFRSSFFGSNVIFSAAVLSRPQRKKELRVCTSTKQGIKYRANWIGTF